LTAWTARLPPSVVAAAAVGLAVRVWAASYGPANFDGDEAMFALIGQRALTGRIDAFAYGQRYMGTIEALAAAPFLALFPYDVFAARAGALLFFALFLLVHGAVVARWWGGRVAGLSTLLLALPGWTMLRWTDRPVSVFGALLTFGTAALLVARPPSAGPARPRWLILLGALLGLALWSHPLALVYVGAIGAVALLRWPAWCALRERLASATGRGWPPLLAATIAALAASIVLAAFADACEPAATFGALRRLALALLAGTAVVTSAALLRGLTPRPVATAAAALTAGLLLGSSPAWLVWLADGVGPATGAIPACPTGIGGRLSLLVTRVLPDLWGLPPPELVPGLTAAELLIWLSALATLLLAHASFVVRSRRSLGRLLTLAPLQPGEVPAATVALLIAGSLGLVLLGGNLVDHLRVRYLIIAWQASSIVVALFVVRLAGRSRVVAALAFGLLLWQTSVLGLRGLAIAWRDYDGARTAAEIRQLEQYLLERHVDAGFADYWIAHTLDFEMGERVALAPYSGVVRLPDYQRRAEAAPVRAYVLPAGVAPPEARTAEALAATLAAGEGGMPPWPAALDVLRRSAVVERAAVGGWDVWLVRRPE
jgi:hypothetical protein